MRDIMPRFRFALQPALERSHENETLARSILVDARLASDEVLGLLAAVESRIADMRAAASLVQRGGAGSFAATEAATIALSVLQRRRRCEAETARDLLERAREIYARSTQERRALERLRERRLAEYRERAAAVEAAELDEANGLRGNEAGTALLRRSPRDNAASA